MFWGRWCRPGPRKVPEVPAGLVQAWDRCSWWFDIM